MQPQSTHSRQRRENWRRSCPAARCPRGGTRSPCPVRGGARGWDPRYFSAIPPLRPEDSAAPSSKAKGRPRKARTSSPRTQISLPSSPPAAAADAAPADMFVWAERRCVETKNGAPQTAKTFRMATIQAIKVGIAIEDAAVDVQRNTGSSPSLALIFFSFRPLESKNRARVLRPIGA